jgi:hypothetical protein
LNDIAINDNCDQNSHFNFPCSISDTTGNGYETFTGSQHFTVQEIEVFEVS